jgi:hypothetical protein
LKISRIFQHSHYEGKVTVGIQDVTTADFSKLVPEKVHLVIACGILTHLVLSSREDALKALDSAVQVLNDDGHVLITGHGRSWIYASDLEERNFDVLNRFSPIIMEGREFYVARKKQ